MQGLSVTAIASHRLRASYELLYSGVRACEKPVNRVPGKCAQPPIKDSTFHEWGYLEHDVVIGYEESDLQFCTPFRVDDQPAAASCWWSTRALQLPARTRGKVRRIDFV